MNIRLCRESIRAILLSVMLLLISPLAHAQEYNSIDEQGNVTRGGSQSNNFNPHNNDTTKKNKVVPKGLKVWTVDRKFGDISKAEVDTMPHLYPQSCYATGRYGQFNTIGSNYLARQNRIFADRPATGNFFFTDAYDQVVKQPDEWHYTNTLSPFTNLTYDNCGDKTNGEDHVDARFAANIGKQFGFGFDLNYLYARGYFQNQNTSHFNATIYASYLGEQYQLHAFYSKQHEKATENGGITNDNFITHPDLYTESYSDNEIPTILERNWNRNDNWQLFLTHRYSLGFYRKVKMTDEEIKARQFAIDNEKEENKKDSRNDLSGKDVRPMGRPENAVIAGNLPTMATDSAATDTTRIKVESKAVSDSLLAQQAIKDSLEALMKQEFVPVTSFIHTVDMGRYNHRYQAYQSPDNYYTNTFYDTNWRGFSGDSIYDQTLAFNIKNTLAVALMEGFNKYAPAGLKVFMTHELRQYQMPQLDEQGIAYQGKWNEHNVSIGGQLQRTQGHTLHYNLLAETWLAGEDAGQLKLDAQTDLNFPVWGDSVHLIAKAYFYRLNPSVIERRYHAKHFWWDNHLDKTTRTRIEGALAFDKTKTKLRVAIEEIQNYTYLGMYYDHSEDAVTTLSANIRQHTGNINVLTAQLEQQLKAGPLHWDNIITYQSSSNKEVLPLPQLNVFTNLYLDFMVAHVLKVELGSSATWFTKYNAPDFCPQLNTFAIQENADSRKELGNFPFIDVYANLHLKHTRFYIMMSNVTGTSFNRQNFLVPHHPMNRSVLHMGVSWNFFN